MITPVDPRIVAIEAMAVPLGTLVNDLNNALSTIATTAHNAHIGGPQPEDLSQILASVDRMATLIADLRPLVGSARTRGAASAVELIPILRPVEASLVRLTGRPIAIAWDLPVDAQLSGGVDDFVRSILAHMWVAADDSAAHEVTARLRPTPLGWSLTVEAAGARRYGPVTVAFVEA